MLNPERIKEEQTAENHPAEAHSPVTVGVQWELSWTALFLHLYVGVRQDLLLQPALVQRHTDCGVNNSHHRFACCLHLPPGSTAFLL